MTHLVTMKADPRDPDTIYLCTPPDLAPTMGAFGPARFVGSRPPVPGASYALPADRLNAFRVFATNRGIRLVDTNAPPTARPAWMEQPLPECTHCGQPARRRAHLDHCPNCGNPWAPVEVGTLDPHYQRGPVTTCTTCDATTPAGFTHCTACGSRHAHPG